ncbi:MAG: 2OG-Fe(II) oxygenase [Hydrogenovibrio sp.]|nr:2OG-Fe(II) oxygenase [Hydrogenovibrio sp.]
MSEHKQTMLFSHDPADEAYDTLIDALVDQNYFIWPHAVEDDLCQALLNEAYAYQASGELQRAGVGRGHEHQLNQKIRGDKIKWLDGETPAQQRYLAQMAELQQVLNRALFLGLFEYECHFALYQPGDFYKKHYDSFKAQANRVVTTVLYLNPNWRTENGGELVIYTGKAEETIKVSPAMGTLVVFMSEEILHEVLPAKEERFSIAGWFRLNTMQGTQVDPPSNLLTY